MNPARRAAMQRFDPKGLNDELPAPLVHASHRSGERVVTRVPGASRFTRAPDAAGVLSATPLVHLLAYAVRRRLTGELALREPEGAEHAITFVDGGVAHVKTALDRAPVVAARAVEARVAALVALVTDETSYAFYEQAEDACDVASAACEPLDLLLVAARAWDDPARLDAAMLRLGTDPLVLKVGATLEEVALTPLEHAALQAITEERVTVAELLARHADEAPALRRFLYVLAITGQLVVTPSRFPARASDRAASSASARESLLGAPARIELALQRGDVDGALAEAAHAVALAPDDCDAVALHVWVSSMKASDDEAPAFLAGFDRVLERDPRNELALFHRGKLLQRLGRPRDALQVFTLLLYANAGHRGARSEVRLLERRGVR